MAARDRSRSPSAASHPATSRPSPALAQPAYDPQQNTDFYLNPAHTDLYSQQKNGGATSQTYLSPDPGAFDYTDQLPPAGAYQPQLLGPDPNSAQFPSFDFDQVALDGDGALDPSVLADLTPSNFDLAYPTSTGSGTSLDPMATMQPSATPPHLLPEMAHRQSNGFSASSSPSAQQSPFHPAQRARAPSDTLDPSSAMFPHGQNEWSQFGAYRGHQRTPSDNYSDISSHSNQGSPYMPNIDSFDANARSSPLLDPTHDPAFNDALGLNHFTLSDIQPVQQYGHSPGHSPHISPRLSPQQPLPIFSAEDNFGFDPTLDETALQQPINGLNMYPNIGNEPFPTLQSGPGEMGNADAMSPPEINIYPAPPSKTSMDTQQPNLDDEALSPPLRSTGRNRMRAKSAPHGGSRPSSPAFGGRGRSPSLQPAGLGNDSLTPFDMRGDQSRSPSPARERNGSLSRGRSSSNPSEQREHVLALANNERTPSSGGEKRQQKHPATFQCPLCPKRFTRAYNLRSHLRTHTDERPFVCTVCGKAFARQHDRRRHESLHSGEKKFVCRGALQSGAQWGCGRRFARADALGRHFRSEAGRVCIAPLLEEEAAERQQSMLAEHAQAPAAQDPAMAGMSSGLMSQPNVMASFLPAAILAQYPVLANIDWSALPAAGGGGAGLDDEAYSGRSSFEASSGGDMYEDLSDGDLDGYTDQEMSDVSGLSGQQQPGLSQSMSMAGVPSNSAAQGFGLYGNPASDYLSGFEGR